MIGAGLARGLARKAAVAAGAAGAALVAMVALGATIYYALLFLLPPLGAAAVTALIFAVVAGLLAMSLTSRAAAQDDVEDDEPPGLGERAMGLFKERPILGTVAALAGGWIFLRNPALASLVAAAFTERRHSRGSRDRFRR